MRNIKNVPASVHQRLLNYSKANKKDFNQTQVYYAIERFLYRLGLSPYKDTFILKGGVLFLTLDIDFPRPTRDIDLLGFTESSVENLMEIISDVCRQDVDRDDEIVFDEQTITAKSIKENDEHKGIRLKSISRIATAKIPLQIDVGFGDRVYPDPRTVEYPVLLAQYRYPIIRAYAFETLIAEKVHAMVIKDAFNSRIKDFFDIWYLSTTQEYSGPVLAAAIKATFEQRQTEIPFETPFALSESFNTKINLSRWKSLSNKMNIPTPALQEVIQSIKSFLMPVVISLSKENKFTLDWTPDFGWK